jgi:enoyl-CoA hydratase
MKPTRMDLASYQHLKLERKPGNVMLITLNRPEVLNAAHEAMHSELATIWADLGRDEETRVVVVTGAGRAFSAGGDLGMVERQIGNYDLVTSMLKEMSDLVYNMANCEKPIVSAINGVAVGAGLVVALLADISICATDARLGDGHVRLGVAAGDHAAIIWPLLCGMAKAKYFLLTNEPMTGEEAECHNLVALAVDADQLEAKSIAVATKLAKSAPTALRMTKYVLNHWLRQNQAIFDLSAAFEMANVSSGEAQEAIRALNSKTDAAFDRDSKF